MKQVAAFVVSGTNRDGASQGSALCVIEKTAIEAGLIFAGNDGFSVRFKLLQNGPWSQPVPARLRLGVLSSCPLFVQVAKLILAAEAESGALVVIETAELPVYHRTIRVKLPLKDAGQTLMTCSRRGIRRRT